MAAINAFVRAFWEMPPVTRVYMAASVATTLAVQLEIISPFQLYFNPKLIFNSHQYWRLITTFLFFGPLGFNFLFNLVFTYRYCRMLEEEFFPNRTADFFYMFLVGGTLMSMLAYFVNLLFLGHAFTIMLVYIWSRRNPGISMNFFGLITFQAPYLPWVLLVFSILLGSSTVVDIIGIIVGHFYYFFEDVFPLEPHGFRVLKTPSIINGFFRWLGLDEPPLPEEERPEQFNFANNQERPPPPQQAATTDELSSQPPSQASNNPTTTVNQEESGPSTSAPSTSATITGQPPVDELDRANRNRTLRDLNTDQELRARNVGGAEE